MSLIPIIVIVYAQILNTGSIGLNGVARAPAGNFIGLGRSYGGVNYWAYLGIEYARAVKFKNAVKISRPGETIQATKQGPSCLQVIPKTFQVDGSLDCLFIDIYTPDTNEFMPVIVYIQGGQYEYSSPKANGYEYFASSKEVVFVTVQHRLGPLGFLDFNTQGYPSNLGIRDLILALEWVKDNIRAFGGDPNRITIMGNSAGAVLGNVLTKSPMSKDLILRGISLDGSGCGQWSAVPRETARFALREFAKAASCPLPNRNPNRGAAKTAKCLESLNEKQITDAIKKTRMNNKYLLRPYTPVMEGPVPDCVICQYLWKIKSETPYMYLVTTNEGEKMYKNFRLTEDDLRAVVRKKEVERIFPLMFLYKESSSRADKVTQQIVRHYMKGGWVREEDAVQLWEELAGDIMHYIPTDQCLRLQPAGSAWSMYFGYKSKLDPDQGGVKHSELKKFIFTTIQEGKTEDIREIWSKKDLEASIKFVQMITSFAKYGHPMVDDFKWDPYSPGRTLLWTRDGQLTYAQLPNNEDLQFWSKLPYRNKVI